MILTKPKILILMIAMASIITGCVSTYKKSATYTPEHPLRVLMIGNSFSMSCCHYLPKVAASVPNCSLRLEVAYIGGCTFENHIIQYKESASNPEHHPYYDAAWQPASLQELLARDVWDIITIQQGSPLSWIPETYHPWADQLIEIIHETNPQARIMIQQTWSYNAGDDRIADVNTGWKIDQDGMYQRLYDAYQSLAAATGFSIIPTGRAVQYTRERNPAQMPVDYEAYKKELSEKYPCPTPLPFVEDAVGNQYWTKDNQIALDTIHLSPYGDYLQACVWFGALFQRPVGDITFYPEELPDHERLDFYRECAQRAVNDQPQP